MRPAIPAETPGDKAGRQPWEYDPELAKYNAIRAFIEKSGDLSDTTDMFKGYESQWQALNETKGYDCSLRLAMYEKFRRTSPDHLRMSRNEIVRLLSQPKVVVHGGDFIRDDTEEPGFFANVVNGLKRMVGIKSDEPSRPEVSNGRY